MDRRTWAFVVAALLLAVALAAFVAPFASPAPDGLDRFAADQQFAERAQGSGVWTRAPLPDYKVSGIRNASLATGLAGAAGALAVFAAAWGVAKYAARRGAAKSQAAQRT